MCPSLGPITVERGLARLLSLAEGCGLESGESLRNNHCVGTIWDTEVQFPEGINE